MYFSKQKSGFEGSDRIFCISFGYCKHYYAFCVKGNENIIHVVNVFMIKVCVDIYTCNCFVKVFRCTSKLSLSTVL